MKYVLLVLLISGVQFPFTSVTTQGDISKNITPKITLDGEVIPASIQAVVARAAASESSADKLWEMGMEGQGVKVAVIDSGVDFSHPTFKDIEFESYSFVKKVYGYPEDEDATDTIGHGTSVASLITGNGDGSTNGIYRGMAKNVTLISLKVAGGSSGKITVAGLIAAIMKAVELDVDIINLSLGTFEFGEEIDALEDAVEVAVSNGVTVVSSAGNRGKSGSRVKDPFTVGSPGSSPDAITVGNVRYDFSLDSSSSEGPNQLMIRKPDIAAFGASVPVAVNDAFRSKSGTSFSTPIITGLLALIASGRNPGELKSALLRGAKETGLPSNQGALFPNISRAYELLQQDEPYLSPIVKQFSNKYNVAITTSVAQVSWSSNVPLKFITGVYTDVLELDISQNRDIELESNTGISLNFTILGRDSERKALIDLRYTDVDSLGGLDRAIGKDMTPVVNYLESKGFVVDENKEALTYQKLKDYELVIFPDFATEISDTDNLGSLLPLMADSEIQDLYFYYQSGGSVLIDFGGRTFYETYYDEKSQNLQLLKRILDIFGLTISDRMSTSVATGKVVNSTEMGQGFNSVYSGSQGITGGIPLISFNGRYTSVAQISQGRLIVDSLRRWRSDVKFDADFVYGRQRLDWLLDRNLTLETIPRPGENLILKLSTDWFSVIGGTKLSSQEVAVEGENITLYMEKNSRYLNSSILIPNLEKGLILEIGSVGFGETEIPLELVYLYDSEKQVEDFPLSFGTHLLTAFVRISEDTIVYGELKYKVAEDGTIEIISELTSNKQFIVPVPYIILTLFLIERRRKRFSL